MFFNLDCMIPVGIADLDIVIEVSFQVVKSSSFFLELCSRFDT